MIPPSLCCLVKCSHPSSAGVVATFLLLRSPDGPRWPGVVGSESALAIFHVTLSPPPPHGTPLLLRKSGLSQRRETLALSLSSHRTLPQGFQRRNSSPINFSWDRVVSITLDPGLWKSEYMLSFGPIPNIWWIKKLPLSWTSFVEKMAFIPFVSQQKCFCNFICVRYLPVSLRNASPRTFVSRSGGRSAAIRWNPPLPPPPPPSSASQTTSLIDIPENLKVRGYFQRNYSKR